MQKKELSACKVNDVTDDGVRLIVRIDFQYRRHYERKSEQTTFRQIKSPSANGTRDRQYFNQQCDTHKNHLEVEEFDCNAKFCQLSNLLERKGTKGR